MMKTKTVSENEPWNFSLQDFYFKNVILCIVQLTKEGPGWILRYHDVCFFHELEVFFCYFFLHVNSWIFMACWNLSTGRHICFFPET